MNKTVQKAIFRLRERWNSQVIAPIRGLGWRLAGMQVGAGTALPRLSATWPHQVRFGRGCIIEPDCRFKFDGIWQPGPSLVFGDDDFIGAGCEFNIRVGLRVGRHALIASNCYFVDHDHGHSRRDTPMAQQADGAEAAIVLDDDVWIGANVVVLKGVRIGRGAIVAAGSVVNRSIGPYEIWGGVPARKLRDRADEAVIVSGLAGRSQPGSAQA